MNEQLRELARELATLTGKEVGRCCGDMLNITTEDLKEILVAFALSANSIIGGTKEVMPTETPANSGSERSEKLGSANGPDSRISGSGAQRICPHCGQPHLSDDEIMHVCSKPSVTAQQGDLGIKRYLQPEQRARYERRLKAWQEDHEEDAGPDRNERAILWMLMELKQAEEIIASLLHQRDETTQAAQQEMERKAREFFNQRFNSFPHTEPFTDEELMSISPVFDGREAIEFAAAFALHENAELLRQRDEERMKAAAECLRLIRIAEAAKQQRDKYKRKWNDVLEHEDKTLALARKLEAQLREKERELERTAEGAAPKGEQGEP